MNAFSCLLILTFSFFITAKSYAVTEPTPTPAELMEPENIEPTPHLGLFHISVGGMLLGVEGLTLEGAFRLFPTSSFTNNESGIYLVGSIGTWTNAFTNRTDPEVPYDYHSTYRRNFSQLMLQFESFVNSSQTLGLQLGLGLRNEKGHVSREYSRQESIPVFFGSQSRTVDRSEKASHEFAAEAAVLNTGIFCQVPLQFKTIDQVRFGFNLLIPKYKKSSYTIKLPDETEKEYIFGSDPKETWTYQVSMTLVF